MWRINKEEKSDLYLVTCGSHYVSSSIYEKETHISLNVKKEEATVFPHLNDAVRYAKAINGEVLIYGYKEG